MTFFQAVWAWVVAHKEELGALLGSLVLFIWSEVLGSNEKYKSNSIYQLVKSILQKRFGGAAQPAPAQVEQKPKGDEQPGA